MKQERVFSERKAKIIINAANRKFENEASPEHLVKYQEIVKKLQSGNITASDFFKYGCPFDYVGTYARFCEDKKAIPTNRDVCTYCWFLALTENRH